ncbi:MAG: erythromycin esterase family protein [Acinetobacter sp.]|nr:MAG: erythromycin esterase family protein [Acinetobacter sp.]
MENNIFKRYRISSVFILCFFGFISVCAGQSPVLNLGFEHHKSNLQPFIWGFDQNNLNFTLVVDTTEAYSGKGSLSIKNNASKSSFAVYNFLDKAIYKSHDKMSLSCYVKYKNITSGGAPKIYINEQGGIKKIYKISNELPVLEKGKQSDWTRITIEVEIDTTMKRLMFGIIAFSGEVWFDNLAIELDGVLLADQSMPEYPSQTQFLWLNNYTSPLDTANNNTLKYTKKDLKKVEIIGLGESTHGTHEFFKTKASLIKELIRDFGFSVIAFETPMAEAHEINKFIIDGVGDLDEMMNNRYLFSINKNTEIKELLLWLKNENLSRSHKIHFEGVDMQKPTQALKNIVNYFGENKIIGIDVKIISDFLSSNPNKAKYQEIKSRLTTIKEYINKNERDLNLDAFNLKWAKQNVELLLQMSDENLFGRLYSKRDSLMAANLIFLKNLYTKDKVIFWAHNSHIQSTNSIGTGTYLKKQFLDAYYSIGFATGEGNVRTFDSYGVSKVSRISKSYEGSIDFHLSSLNRNNYFLNLKKLNEKEPSYKKKLINQLNFRMMGFNEKITNYSEFHLTENFDALIFIKNSTATSLK